MYPSAPIREQLPAHILAPYVVVAADDVERGKVMDPLSERALREAVLVLSGERASLLREERPNHNDIGAALATPTGNSLQIATLLVEARSRDQQTSVPDSYDQAVARDAAVLSELIQMLERTLEGDEAAAREVGVLFGHVVDRVLVS
jgi:hypothetical protein